MSLFASRTLMVHQASTYLKCEKKNPDYQQSPEIDVHLMSETLPAHPHQIASHKLKLIDKQMCEVAALGQ